MIFSPPTGLNQRTLADASTDFFNTIGQSLPLAAGRQHVEDGVQHLANVHLAPASATLGRRNHRLDQRPFGLAQITRIARSATLGSAAVFRLPHRAPLNGHSGATQGITTDSSDSTTSWIGSKTG